MQHANKPKELKSESKQPKTRRGTQTKRIKPQSKIFMKEISEKEEAIKYARKAIERFLKSTSTFLSKLERKRKEISLSML